jgi:polysaccharide export outer membrane protein
MKRLLYFRRKRLLRILKTLAPACRQAVFILFTLYLFSSCIPQRKLIYLQDEKGKEQTSQTFNNPIKYYKVKPGDELYIKVVGLDEKTSTLFTDKNDQRTLQFIEKGIYFQSYTVSDSGTINLPTIEKVFVSNMTIDEIQNVIQDKLKDFVNFGSISVKLANFRVSVLGEVETPSNIFIADDITTIFEVLSLAGDMTPYGNRQEVNIIRQSKDGLTYNKVDLTAKNFLNSEFYYIYPGDVVYVPQLKGKAFGFAEFQWGTLLSIISTTLSAISIIVLIKNQ